MGKSGWPLPHSTSAMMTIRYIYHVYECARVYVYAGMCVCIYTYNVICTYIHIDIYKTTCSTASARSRRAIYERCSQPMLRNNTGDVCMRTKDRKIERDLEDFYLPSRFQSVSNRSLLGDRCETLPTESIYF